MSWIEATARWYAVLAAVTWALAPAVRWLCNSLSDKGATVTRPIAVLAAVYPAWLLASFGVASFSTGMVAATVMLAGGLGWAPLIRRHVVDRCWIRELVLVEIASFALFGGYVWLRGYTPQILGTEKPMDIAFLASSTRAVTMPPLDPWFGGEPINYYYLGYLLHGTVGRLSGVSPETGFNLALATAFSMTAVAAFGVARNVIHPWFGSGAATASGLFAAFAVTLAGNLYAPWRLLQNAPETVSAWWWDSVNGIGWRSSRIVCDGPRFDNLCSFPSTETINEFPFFSFLLGDLHPHVMALPYTLVAIALGWNLARRAIASPGTDSAWLARVLVSGGVIGALYALNAWDFPTYLLLGAAGVRVGEGLSVRRAAKPLVILVAASVAAWLPFWATYVPPTSGGDLADSTLLARLPVVSTLLSAVGLHLGERTSIGEYLTIFGVPYAFGIALVVTDAVRRSRSPSQQDFRALLIAGAAAVLAGILVAAPVIPLCGIPLAVAIRQRHRSLVFSPRAFAVLLFAFAWALSIVVELVFVRDAFADRMNTLFKFYYQIWTLYSVAAGVTVAVLWMEASRTIWHRAALVAATIAALFAGIVYPAVASYQWTEGFQTWRGLDGLAYGEASDPEDTAAIRWLSQRAAEGDAVLEAAGCSYHPFGGLPFNRVSAFTGLPTVIGWGDNHQRQWRAGQPALIDQIDARQGRVVEMYANPESPLFDEYGVTWLFVGNYETGEWQSECAAAGPYDGPATPGYPGPGWEEAFRSGDSRVYRQLAN